jgi:RNA polymerase sigma factor (sigma-70 family)
LTRDLLVSSIERVYALLTPRQRWQITVRNRRRKQSGAYSGARLVEFLPDPGIGPEQEAQKQQDLERLQNALNRLPSNQRLLLSLRFQEGLSLKKIAELNQLGDTSRAWRQLQSALKALYQNMHSEISEINRKT